LRHVFEYKLNNIQELSETFKADIYKNAKKKGNSFMVDLKQMAS